MAALLLLGGMAFSGWEIDHRTVHERAPAAVTLIGGFLGAGKTTLLNRMIEQLDASRLGVLVNDFGAINVDAELVEGVEDDVISLANGCLCCTIRNDVVRALRKLLDRDDRPDRILVETSGASDPGTVAKTFLELQRSQEIHLDGFIAVVDAVSYAGLPAEDAVLAKCQVMASDLVVINKIDEASPEQVDEVEALVRLHAPWARLIRATHADVALDLLIGHDPPVDARLDRIADTPPHGYGTWTFTTEDPIAFAELAPVFNELPPTIMRVKGWLNIAERPGARLLLHVVGRRVYVRTVGPREGEPKTTLVLIGRDLDPADLATRFERCVAR